MDKDSGNTDVITGTSICSARRPWSESLNVLSTPSEFLALTQYHCTLGDLLIDREIALVKETALGDVG